MLFRNIIFTAFFSALIAGLLLGTLQWASTSNIIYNAEVYEVAEEPIATTNEHAHTAEHSHNKEAWSPQDGTERIAYTFLADILIAFGHSLLLTSFMAILFLKFAKPNITWKSGLIVGFGGYLSFYLATVIGLPPELPGTLAADLHARQLWWTLTVIATIIGLSALYLLPAKFKIIGFVFIVLPHLIGAPHPEIAGFVNKDALAVSALSQLEHKFFVSTAWINLLYWLTLGATSGWFASKSRLFENRKQQVLYPS